MSRPFFSVVIPTYNRMPLLERAVKSVLKQTCKDFELIVVDDGSTDETQKYLSALRDKFKNAPFEILRQDNAGVSSARNLGIQKSKGRWVAFLDSDDEWQKNKLSIQKKYLEENPEIFWAHGNEKWIRDGNFLNQKKVHQKEGGDIFTRSLGLCLVSPSTVVIKKELFDQLGSFNEEFIVCEDYDLWLRFLNKYPVGFCPEVLITKYGGHDDQLSQRYKAMDYYRVLSIDRLLPKIVSEKNKNEAKKVLVKKCQILLAGYKKYQHPEKENKIKRILSKYFD